MEKLFVYGTLQDPAVQTRVFGRVVSGTPDSITGYYKSQITTHEGTYPIIKRDSTSSVDGQVIEVTAEELILIDGYEAEEYRRIRVTLNSGTITWVYCE
jgi:gamma-glutamylcyclotransferase (GGCT)/AIG2-like uncharacterized protein YtfP